MRCQWIPIVFLHERRICLHPDQKRLHLLKHNATLWHACSYSPKHRHLSLDLETCRPFEAHQLPWSEQTGYSLRHLAMDYQCAPGHLRPSRGIVQIDRWWLLLRLVRRGSVASILHHLLCYETGWQYHRQPRVAQLWSIRVSLYVDFHPTSQACPWFVHLRCLRCDLCPFSISWRFFSSFSFLCPIQL